MSRYVDIEGDWVDDAIKAYSLGYYEDDEYAIPIERFDSAPSIDIVRCKECKWEWTMKCPPHRMGLIHTDDDYCSFGVKSQIKTQISNENSNTDLTFEDEPQTCSFSDCDNFKNPDYERCIECKRKQIKLKTEQTEREGK